MNRLAKSAPLGTLGLPVGDHWVKFHVEDDTISYEVTASLLKDEAAAQTSQAEATQAFVQKWSGKGRLVPESEMADDARLAALTAKHVH
jgi:hypothetical protein